MWAVTYVAAATGGGKWRYLNAAGVHVVLKLVRIPALVWQLVISVWAGIALDCTCTCARTVISAGLYVLLLDVRAGCNVRVFAYSAVL